MAAYIHTIYYLHYAKRDHWLSVIMVTYLEEAKVVIRSTKNFLNKIMRQPGIEPGSIAWKATMLTFTPPTLLIK